MKWSFICIRPFQLSCYINNQKYFLSFNLIFSPLGRLFILFIYCFFFHFFFFEGIVVVIGGITFVPSHKFTPGTLYFNFIFEILILLVTCKAVRFRSICLIWLLFIYTFTSSGMLQTGPKLRFSLSVINFLVAKKQNYLWIIVELTSIELVANNEPSTFIENYHLMLIELMSDKVMAMSKLIDV